MHFADDLHLQNLAFYIRSNEKALADSLLLQKQASRHTHTTSVGSIGSTTRPGTSASNAPSNVQRRASVSAGTTSWLPSWGRSKLKPARLFLNPNQLYYLLSRFEELGVETGPTNIRLENIHAEPSSSSNYVSFLAQTQVPKIRSYDTDSIKSVTSVRSSLVSNVSQLLSNISFTGNSASKTAKQEAVAREDIRYLYSAFTKIPCLKISVDHRLRPIAGFEEFPFDTAVPLNVFKNLTSLEVANIDFRSVYGWDFLADHVRNLTVKRAGVEDLAELLHDVVLDDMDQRRRRSSTKTPQSPGVPLGASLRSSNYFANNSPIISPPQMAISKSSEGQDSRQGINRRQSKHLSRSVSPQKYAMGHRASVYGRRPEHDRRSSASSQSSTRVHSPRQSSSSLLLHFTLPSTKWRFLSHLSVPDNGLTSISTEALLPLTDSLQSLDLSSNLFTEIPDALSSLVSLRALNMSSCLIESVRDLARSPLPAITVLNLKGNRLSSLAGIEKLKSLQRLDIRENALSDPAEAARLTGMPDFYEMYVRRNPFTKSHSKHRVIIFNLFRSTPGYTQDVFIDGELPTRSERRQLADRAPEPPGRAVMELEEAMDSIDTSLGSKRKAASDEETSTPTALNSQKRKKAPKRRIVEVAEPGGTPISRENFEDPQTVFMTAREEQGTERRLHRPVNQQTSPTQRRVEGSSDTIINGRPGLSQAVSEIAPPSRAEEAYEISRPSLSRNLSSSNEIYRKRIEALKTGQGNASWLDATTARELPKEPQFGMASNEPLSPRPMIPLQVSGLTAINI